MKVRVYAYILFFMLFSAILFYNNLIDNYFTETAMNLWLFMVILSFVSVRYIFPLNSKYRVLFIISLLIVYIPFVFSIGVNNMSWELGFQYYSSFPRYSLIYNSLIIYGIIIVVSLSIDIKLKRQNTRIIFFISDILSIFIVYILWFSAIIDS